MADDLGYADVSSYGARDYTTPNVDRLALEGIAVHAGVFQFGQLLPDRTALINRPLPDAAAARARGAAR